MSPTLKRRADVIADNDRDSESVEPPARRRQRSSSTSSATSSDMSITLDTETQTQAQSQGNIQNMIKKLVRLALSTEYARLPLRRSDISQKILKDNNASHKLFKPVFSGAQTVLQHTFGMTLIELPNREKVNLKDRRTQATQTQKSQSAASNKAWILVSTLPKAYKQNLDICPPTRASSQEEESEYTALYTFVLALIYLNNSVLTDAKLERYMKRMNADTYTPAGATDKVLQRMVKEGYIEKRRDISSGEEIIEWVIGPRGKVEVGVRGVANLVKGVYGFGVKQRSERTGEDTNDAGADGGRTDGIKIEEEELDRRLERSLGVEVANNESNVEQHAQLMEAGSASQNPQRPKRGRPRRDNNGNSDDD